MSITISANDLTYDIEFDKRIGFNPILNLVNYYESSLKDNKSWLSYEQMISNFLNSSAFIYFDKNDLFSYSVDFGSLGCIEFYFRFNESCVNPFSFDKYRSLRLPKISLISACCSVVFENFFNKFLFSKFKDCVSDCLSGE